MYDITPTISMAQYALYMTSKPCFMKSQHSIHDNKAALSNRTQIISDTTSTISLSLHPDYLSYKPIVHMIS